MSISCMDDNSTLCISRKRLTLLFILYFRASLLIHLIMFDYLYNIYVQEKKSDNITQNAFIKLSYMIGSTCKTLKIEFWDFPSKG